MEPGEPPRSPFSRTGHASDYSDVVALGASSEPQHYHDHHDMMLAQLLYFPHDMYTYIFMPLGCWHCRHNALSLLPGVIIQWHEHFRGELMQ